MPLVAPERQIASRLLDAVGKTPLIEIELPPTISSSTHLFAKLESSNPGGSIKDRPVARMLTRAQAQGRFAGGRRLLDSSSGNAGIAYAQFGSALEIGITLVIPGNASKERLERIAAHGAEVILTDPLEGYDFAVHTARRLAEEEPERYWYCNQYSNGENWRAHFDSTGPEILEQVQEHAGELPDTFVAGVGTGGTLTGVGRRLRTAQLDLHIAVVVPELFPGIEGLKPLGRPEDFVPEILDVSLIDQRIEVTLEQAIGMCGKLARQGLFVGPSSGANVHAALEIASSGHHKNIVTVLSDAGERYGSTGMWQSQRN